MTSEVADARSVPFLDLGSMTEEVAPEVIAGWTELLRTGAFIGGAAVSTFEESFAEYCGSSHAIGVANGTDALHLALRALEIGPGDQVIVPANTFVATVEAVVLAGAQPRFADVDAETLLLTAETIQAAYTPSCRAVIVVHLYGQVPDMDAIGDVARERSLVLVEDAAQAQGATWRDRRAGSFGAVAAFSFYPGKNLGAFGDAGAVVTSDPQLAAAVRSMRDHGRSQGTHHEHDRLGMNSRLDAMQAVVLSAKLRLLDGWNAARRTLMEVYQESLLADRAVLVRQNADGVGIHHVAVARVKHRDRLRDTLAAQGVATGVHYPTPCHVMAPFRKYADGRLPAAELAARHVLSLPLSPYMTVDEVEHVSEMVNTWAEPRR